MIIWNKQMIKEHIYIEYKFAVEVLQQFNVWLLNDTYNPLKSNAKSLCSFREYPVEANPNGIYISCDQKVVGRL